MGSRLSHDAAEGRGGRQRDKNSTGTASKPRAHRGGTPPARATGEELQPGKPANSSARSSSKQQMNFFKAWHSTLELSEN
jgi:hypothetical protein